MIVVVLHYGGHRAPEQISVGFTVKHTTCYLFPEKGVSENVKAVQVSINELFMSINVQPSP